MNRIELPKLFDLEKMSRREPRMQNGFYHKDILSVDQFDKDALSYIFTRSEEMAEMTEKVGRCDLLKGTFKPACSTNQYAHQFFLHRRHGTVRRRHNSDHPGYPVLFCIQGREPGGYHTDAGKVLGPDRPAPP
jgi:hypothetical protein